jgi:hypothetical protein
MFARNTRSIKSYANVQTQNGNYRKYNKTPQMLSIRRNGNKQRKVLLTYDSLASHTTLNKALKQELCLKENSVGNFEIQTYAGSVQEEGFVVTASIDGMKPQKIDFLVSENAQKMPVCKYDIPEF